VAREKALVTGASGFTGSHLALGLLARGYEVHGFVRSAARGERLARAGVKLAVGDVTDAAAADAAVRGMDRIFHVAATYRQSGAADDEYYKVNVLGTKHFLDAALRHGAKRFVHCSTVGVHGHVDNPPADEDAPLRPGDLYQETKLEGERLVGEYMKWGLPAVVFRPVGICGPGDMRFLKLFRAVRKGTFVMFGDGNVLYHLTYIDDLVRGIIACGEDPRAVGKVYIIAGERAVTLNELVEKIAATVGSPAPRWRFPFWTLWAASVVCEGLCKPLGLNPPLFRRRADFFRKSRAFTGARIERELGFTPRFGLDETLRRTAEWYKAQQLI
jgi:dihydroflavonol-4-reductase